VRTELLFFLYTLAATIGMGTAWLISNGPWTQGDTVIGVVVLFAEVLAGWNRKDGGPDA
jgi:hypothetical protein